MSVNDRGIGAGAENRTPILSLENLYTNRCTTPAGREAPMRCQFRKPKWDLGLWFLTAQGGAFASALAALPRLLHSWADSVEENRGDYTGYDDMGLEVAHDGDAGTEGIEPLGQVLVTTIDGIDIAQHADTVSGEHTDEQQ